MLNNHFSFSSMFGDIIGLSTGYFLADPSGVTLSFLHSPILDSIPNISQPVVDEIVKAIAALVITFLSRVLFDRFDKIKNKKEEKKRAQDKSSEEEEEKEKENEN